MYALALRMELRIPQAHSLKEKRSILKSLQRDLHKKFSVSVAEVDHQDQWQRSSVGVALISGQQGQLERVRHSIERFVDGYPDVELLSASVSHLVED